MSIPIAESHYSGPRYSPPATELVSSTTDEALGCLHLLPAVSLSICAMSGPPIKKEIYEKCFTINTK